MKIRIGKPLTFFVAAIFAFGCLPSYATPKAAENENSPVTTGADVAKPRIFSKPAKKQASQGKKPGVKKMRGDQKSSKVTRTARGRR